MTEIVFYEKPGCASNARQKRLLLASGHELIVRDLLQTRWRAEELQAFFGQRPVAEWFNPAAPAVKSGAVVPEAQTASSALQLMLQDPLLIRRPLLQVGERREAGFNHELIAAWIGLSPLSTVARDTLETCRKSHSGLSTDTRGP